MKKQIFILSLATIMLSSGFVWLSSAPDCKLGEDYSIAFKSKDPSGEFKVMKGSISFSEDDLAGSKFNLSFDVNSISTGNGMMNKKAQIAEWFDAVKYPKITYVSSKVEKSSEDFMVYGTLKIKGTAKEQKVPLKLEKSGKKLVFRGSFKVNRLEYKVGKKSETVPDVMQINYVIPVTQN